MAMSDVAYQFHIIWNIPCSLYWSGSVRDFQNFVGPGPVRSEIFKILLVLVRFGPRFSKFCWSWSGPVQNFLKICWFWSGSVLDFRLSTEIGSVDPCKRDHLSTTSKTCRQHIWSPTSAPTSMSLTEHLKLVNNIVVFQDVCRSNIFWAKIHHFGRKSCQKKYILGENS